MVEPTVPDEVYREAAEARFVAAYPYVVERAAMTTSDSVRIVASTPSFRAAVEVAYRAGRNAAAQAIRAHADEHFPVDEEPYRPARRTFRRHLLAAARIADNPITLQQAAEALRSGNYIACTAEDIEGTDG